jgi:NAD(P)-dependent dehydrogenase (short-subunit alcohol dehydrogenase family)
MPTNASAHAVLITGAGSGIGEACAKRMAALGWRVFAGVLDDEQRRHVEQSRLGGVTPVVMDITDPEAIAAAVRLLTSELGDAGLTGLVNNAGIPVMGPLEYVPIDQLRRQLEVNLVAQVAVTQAMLPLVRKATGRIVNIASMAGRLSVPLLGPYTASKHAMEAVSDTLRLELARWNIQVACIEPALIDTPILAAGRAASEAALAAMPAAGQELYRPLFEALRRDTGINRAAQPPDVVARAVVHALTARRPKTRYVVGGRRRTLLLISKLPDRLRDWALLKLGGG